MKLIIYLLTLLLFVGLVSANIFTEICYDPVGSDYGNEWVEVFGSPLNDALFIEDGGIHSLRLVQGICDIDCVSIIAQNANHFLNEYKVSQQTLVYDSAWSSLRNSGETIGLIMNNTTTNVTYLPSAKSPLSLQIVEKDWIAKKPSPGFVDFNNSSESEIIVEVPEFPSIVSLIVLFGGMFILRKSRKQLK